MTTTTAPPTAWPVNLGAYAKALAGGLVGLLPAGVIIDGALDANGAAALLLAAAGHVAHLLTGRPRLKVAITWTATVAAALVLGAGQYEGAGGLTLGHLAQWDAHDLATIGALAVGSLIHQLVPNAPARYADADAAAGATTGTRDVVDPTMAPTDGDAVEHEGGITQLLQALSPAQVAAHAAAAAPLAALVSSPVVPVQALAPAAESTTPADAGEEVGEDDTAPADGPGEPGELVAAAPAPTFNPLAGLLHRTQGRHEL